MPENKSLEYCILNVSASPHPTGVYKSLLEVAAKQPVGYWGDHFATISTPHEVEPGFYQGRLFAWTEIDESEPAINTERLEEVDFDDLDIEIPDNIGFNGRVFSYVFRESDHKLFIETRNDLSKRLSPSRAQKIFRLLLGAEVQGIEAPLVEVTVVPEIDALPRIFSIQNLRRLKIHIVRPNADDLEIQHILDRLEAQHLKSEDTILLAAPQTGGIEPNEETKIRAEVAANNGYVEGGGYDSDGEAVRLSTKQYPRIIKRSLEGMSSVVTQALQVARSTIIGPSDN